LFYASKILKVSGGKLVVNLSRVLSQFGNVRAAVFHASAGAKESLGSFIFKVVGMSGDCRPPFRPGDAFPGEVLSELSKIKDKTIKISARMDEVFIDFNERIAALESDNIAENLLLINEKLDNLQTEIDNLVITGGGAVWE
jgi:hypothetical protein